MKHRHRVLAGLAMLAVITYVDRVCISVAGKTIQEELGLSLSQWGWVLGAFVLAYGLFEIPSGTLGDRIGPRRTLTRIVTWWSVFTALTGMMRSFGSLATIRFLFGLGEAGAFPNSSVAVARWFPRGERARAQGAIWMATRLGGALAPLLVIPLQRAYGWRASFYVFALGGIVWAFLWHRWFRDTPAEMSGITAAELGEIGTREKPSPHGLPWRLALAQPNLWWIMLMYFAQAWAGFFYLTWLHTFLENGRGYTKDDLIVLSWLPFVFGALANLAGGFFSDALVQRIGLKWGRRAIGATGLALASLLTAGTAFVEGKVATILLLALGYACSDFVLPSAWAVCLDVGQKYAGAVTGAMNTAGQAGSFLSTVLFGYFVTRFGSYNAPLFPIATMSALGAIFWLKIDPTVPLQTERPPTACRPVRVAPAGESQNTVFIT